MKSQLMDSSIHAKGSREFPSALFIVGFDIGHSFIFHDENSENTIRKDWKSMFEGRMWRCKQFTEFRKPMGWASTLAVRKMSCLRKEVKELREAFDEDFRIKLNKNIRAIFFTPGVGVLLMRMTFKEPLHATTILQRLNDTNERRRIRQVVGRITDKCSEYYSEVLLEAREKVPHSGFLSKKPKWTLEHFQAVTRNSPNKPVFFLLSFVDDPTYRARTAEIEKQIAGSVERRRMSLDNATVRFRKSELHIGWFEALVNASALDVKAQLRIERLFTIAMASWSALSMMERHSAKDLFDAFVETVTDKPYRPAADVHIKAMAYSAAADAAYPIRWTTNEAYLNLLEAIHRNWSSSHLQSAVNERMMLLNAHYERIETERKERLSRRFTFFGVVVAVSTLASAAASVIGLASKDPTSHIGALLRHPLQVDVLVSLSIPIVATVLFLTVSLLGKPVSSSRMGRYVLHTIQRISR
jgi:hypothetical protein